MPLPRFPHPLALLTGCILAAAIASHAVPAGEYERREDPVTGRRIVVAGTFHPVPAHPVGAFDALVDIPRGLADAGSVIFLVFLVGGAFTVVDDTGALRQAVGWMVARLRDREALVIPIVSIAFALGGALENMSEEIIALVPVLLLVTRPLGFDAVTAIAISIGAAAVGAAFSPINPFQVQIAQKLAALPLLSGWLFRVVALTLALSIWILATWRHAARTRVPPSGDGPGPGARARTAAQAATDGDRDDAVANERTVDAAASVPAGLGVAKASRGVDTRRGSVLAIVLAAAVIFVYGVVRLGWDFDQMSALFFAMGLAAGLAGGLGIAGTSQSFVTGFASMAYAAMLIGFARAIFIVLDHGRIIDTIVHALVAPLASLPVTVSALGMLGVQAAVHFPVPSVSGQAVLTMPVLVPMADLIGLSRQVVVLAYQYGAGLTDLVTPTNGALMAVTAAAGVKYTDWLLFAVPVYLCLLSLGAIALVVAIRL